MVDLQYASSLLTYEHETGLFRWKVDRGGKAKSGGIAGSIDSKGYVQIKLCGRLFLAHRLAWLFVHGEWPKSHIDHKDRNPKNNALNNLRLCTHAQNHQNTGLRSDNTSGVTGVSWIKRQSKWLAYIDLKGKRHRLGLYDSKENAVAARLSAKQKLHKFHPLQG